MGATFSKDGVTLSKETLSLLNGMNYRQLGTAVGLVPLVVLLKWVYDRKRKHSLFLDYAIPHVKPNFLTGSLCELSKNNGKNFIAFMDNGLSEYGKIFGYYIGETPYLVVADLDLVEEVLVKNVRCFQNRPLCLIKGKHFIHTLIGLRDHRWSEIRKLLAEILSRKPPQHRSVCIDKVKILEDLIWRSCEQGNVIEWFSTFQALTFEIVSECVLGLETRCQEDKDEPIFKAAVEYTRTAADLNIYPIMFPFISPIVEYIDNNYSTGAKKMKMIVSTIEKLIEVRLENLGCKKDILQKLIDSSEMNIFNTRVINVGFPGNAILTKEEVVANAWVLLIGGFENNSNTLTIIVYLLARHPKIQEKLYHEIKNFIPRDETGTLKFVEEIPYLNKVINECLRMYPPVLTFVSREASMPTKIGPYDIPADMCIQIPIWNIHRDPTVWPEPETFDPERFLADGLVRDNHKMAHIPFGAGPRMCPLHLDLLIAKITLARLLLKYRFEATPETPEELDFVVYTVTIAPKDIHVKVVPRDNNS